MVVPHVADLPASGNDYHGRGRAGDGPGARAEALLFKTNEEALGLGLGKAHGVEHVLRSFERIRTNP
jgi:hypothetical protein